MLSDQVEQHRMQLAERKKQVEALRHRNGELEGMVVELRGQCDQMVRDIDGLRQRMETPPADKAVAKRRLKRDTAPSKTVQALK